MRIVVIVVGTWCALSLVATVAYVAFRWALARTPADALALPEPVPGASGPEPERLPVAVAVPRDRSWRVPPRPAALGARSVRS